MKKTAFLRGQACLSPSVRVITKTNQYRLVWAILRLKYLMSGIAETTEYASRASSYSLI
ncbi:MAG: hypothetical protein ACTS73_05505 [Arsenophonus sp. NEOnobi-MAG3]